METFKLFSLTSKEGTIINKKNVLRLRKEQDKIELTYKKVQVTQQQKLPKNIPSKFQAWKL